MEAKKNAEAAQLAIQQQQQAAAIAEQQAKEAEIAVQ
jgi:hypothetical protein